LPGLSIIVHAHAAQSKLPDLALGWRDGRPVAIAECLPLPAAGTRKTFLFFDSQGYARSITELNRVDIDRYSKQKNSAPAMGI
jgi:hypothetical protein